MTRKASKDVKNPSGQALVRAVDFVKQRLPQLEPLARRKQFSDNWTRWWRATVSGIKQHFGGDSDEYNWVNPLYRPFATIGEEDPQRKAARERKEYGESVKRMRNALQSILDKYEALGPTITASETLIQAVVTKAFISHGGRKLSLTRIEDFLRVLGVEPVVVERQSSESREVHHNVDHYRELCDFAIVLWTKDLKDEKGNWHPSGSVSVESGELRMQFKNRVIYLHEAGVSLPAMASSIVFETYTVKNMGPAFQRIVTELREWGWLTVSVPGKETPDSRQGLPVGKESPSGDEDILEVEEGLLDWQVGVEESMESAVEQLTGLNASMQDMSGKISRSNDKLRILQQRGAKATEIRRQVSMAAAVMIEFTRDVKKRLPPYHDAWDQFDHNASELLSSIDVTPQARDSAPGAKERLSAMVSSADGLIVSMEGLRETVRDVRQKKLSRDLNYACELTARALSAIVEEVKLSRSIGVKIVNLIDEIVQPT